jgi:ribonuclease T1
MIQKTIFCNLLVCLLFIAGCKGKVNQPGLTSSSSSSSTAIVPKLGGDSAALRASLTEQADSTDDETGQDAVAKVKKHRRHHKKHKNNGGGAHNNNSNNNDAVIGTVGGIAGAAATQGKSNITNPKIPAKVVKVYEYVKANHKAPAGYVGGRTFGNFEHRLAATDAGGRKLNYQEWDVNPKVQGVNRGAERMITGSDGSAWFTNDHYKTFIPIK